MTRNSITVNCIADRSKTEIAPELIDIVRKMPNFYVVAFISSRFDQCEFYSALAPYKCKVRLFPEFHRQDVSSWFGLNPDLYKVLVIDDVSSHETVPTEFLYSVDEVFQSLILGGLNGFDK